MTRMKDMKAMKKTAGMRFVARMLFFMCFMPFMNFMSLSAQQRQNEFVPADQVARETLPAAPLIFVAYAFVWMAILVYLFFIWRRLSRVEHELADVSRRLESRPERRS